jgi:hypothetical protein
MIVAQKINHYRVINPLIGDGTDVSVVIDVPYKEWSALFKPQNLSFFVLPFSMAFAFKWWLLLYLLLLSIYLFVLTLFPRRYLLASLLAVFFGFAPYIQWWYQSITILPVAYTLFLVSIALRLLEAKSRRVRLLYVAAIAYIATCFALVFYPPYQIIAALVGIIVFGSIYISRSGLTRSSLKSLLWIATPLLVAGIIFGAFLLSHKTAVSAELHSVYPGHRVVAPGGMKLLTFFNWPLSYLLQRGGPLSVLGSNQSEASNFLLFGLCLVPHLGLRLFSKKATGTPTLRTLRYLFIGVCILLAVFLAKLFVPLGAPLYHLLGLSSVLQDRLFLGIGIVNIVLIAIAIALPKLPFRGWRSLWSWPAAIMGTAWFVGFIILFRSAKHAYTLPDVGRLELVLVALVCSFLIALLCHQLRFFRYLGVLGITLYALFVSLPINPLYKNTGSLTDSSLHQEIAQIKHSDPTAIWAVVNKIPLESIPTAAGAKSISGVYPYPKTSLWSKYFPGDSSIYNRFAHVTFNIDDGLRQRNMVLVQQDTFSVNLSSCDVFLQHMNIRYLLTVNTNPVSYKCYKPYATIPASGTKVVIYKYEQP